MPVKIRCRGCENTLSAPDSARGKAIQCPQCGTKLKVPAGEVVPKGAKPKPKADPSMMDSAEFMAGVDLSNVEHHDDRICPYCAAEMPAEGAVCRSCGINVETGAMDSREARRRSRKGPDPALFYSETWKDGIPWVKAHWRMAIRTGLYMTLLAVMNAGCTFMATSYCDKGPTIFFWGSLAFLTGLGIIGWYWFLTYKVIEATMTRDEKVLERISFDIFQVVSLGLRFLFWPFIVLGPFVVIVPLLALFYPLATVHLTQKYTYKAFVGWEMLLIALRNFGAAAYFCFTAFVVLIPVALVAGPMFWLIGLDGMGNPFIGSNVHWACTQIADWFLKLTGDSNPDPETFVYIICLIPLKIGAAFLTLAPIFVAAAIPAVFMMRVNGLLGYYNRDTLGLVNFIPPKTPATFWVRFLAHLIDSVLWPFASVLVVKEPKAVLIGWLVNLVVFVVAWFARDMAPFAGLLWSAYMFWMYFAVQEATTTRTTIGKDAFGLAISDVSGKQMTLKQATLRVLGRFCCGLTLGMGYIIAALPPQKRGLHDMIAGTQCTWRGDR